MQETPQITARDFHFIRDLVYRHSRINLGRDRGDFVRARIGKRLKALGLDSMRSYCELVGSPGGRDELTQLIDHISTNFTFFFREKPHFDFLREEVVPAFKQSGKGLRMWSAACSSGEEPYSMALLLAETLGLDAARWQIDATDISTRVLEKAARGIYAEEAVKKLDRALLRPYFEVGSGRWAEHVRVKAAVRERVHFRHLNLFSEQYPFKELFHVIFCRNVMIYFDRATQEQLVRRLSAHLAPGGFLIVGHSESLTGMKHPLNYRSSSIYQAAHHLSPALA